MNNLSIRIIIILLICSSSVLSQKTAMHYNDSLSLSSGVRYGRLANGFTYYIKPVNNTSELKMNLFVKAGNVHEINDQIHIAHLIEHWAFRNPHHFSEDIHLNPSLKENNVQISGVTNPLHTEYHFNIPSFSMEMFNNGLLWFRDITELKFNRKGIAKETKIVFQEGVLKQGNSDYVFLKQKQQLLIAPLFNFPGEDLGQYLNHIKNIQASEVINFYKKWYRPDRMAVVITGNVKEIDVLEEKLRKHFSDIPKPQLMVSEVDRWTRYLKGDPGYAVVQRKITGLEKEGSFPLEFFWYMRRQDDGIVQQNYAMKNLKKLILWDALYFLSARRINSDNIASAVVSPTQRLSPYLQIYLKETKRSDKERLQRLALLLKQMKIYGFSPDEWKIAKKRVLEKQNLNRIDTTKLNYWLEALKNHYIYEEALPENKITELKTWLEGITVDDINTFVKKNINVVPDDISMIVPSGHKAFNYIESEIREWINEVLDDSILPYVQPRVPPLSTIDNKNKGLMSTEEVKALSVARVTHQKNNEETGTEVLMLENGLRVVLDRIEPIENSTGRVEIHGFTPKGANSFQENDYYSAINAPSIVQAAGIGKFDSRTLLEVFPKNSYVRGRAHLYIGDETSGIKTRAKVKDIEKVLQLIHLYLTAPRFSQDPFEKWKDVEKMNFFDSNHLGYKDFTDFYQGFFYGRQMEPLGTKRYYGIKKTKMKTSANIYRQVFQDPSDFTFVISGAYKKQKIVPLLQKYLGSIPKIQKTNIVTSLKNADIDLPEGPILKKFNVKELNTIYTMKSTYYGLQYVKKTISSYDWKEEIKVIALIKIINKKVEELRYRDHAALYKTYVNGGYNRGLKAYKVNIFLDCIEEELDWLRKKCENIIEDVKINGLSEEEFERIMENEIYPLYKSIPGQQPSDKDLYKYFRYLEPIISNKEKDNYVRSLTREDIKRAAQEHFLDEFKMEFIMSDINNKKIMQ